MSLRTTITVPLGARTVTVASLMGSSSPIPLTARGTPVRARATRTTILSNRVSRIEWTTNCGGPGAVGFSKFVHAAAAISIVATDTTNVAEDRFISICSPTQREPECREDRKLWERDACWRRLGVIEDVTEHVMCVVHVHDAHIGRHREPPRAKVGRRADIQSLAHRQSLAIPRSGQKLELGQAAFRGVAGVVWDVADALELADNCRVRRATREVEARRERVPRESPASHQIQIVTAVLAGEEPIPQHIGSTVERVR